ncbi:MAG: hypothetical protein DSM106950_32660 [Stigonema ocellatum SAG 48.90 = DSM 106950]|nr:hypothetical protein [Stigonema ocellatum SAG 48.90 = DSM 106950]
MQPTNSNKKSAKNDDFMQWFSTNIPPQTAATFNKAQLTALKQVFSERVPKRHAVDIRMSIPFFIRGFYVVLLLGKEKRSKERLSNEISKPVNRIFLTLLGLVFITSLLGSLYKITMMLGVNEHPEQQIQLKNSQ